MPFRFVVAGPRTLPVAVGPIRSGESILALTAGKWAILDVAWLGLEYVGPCASFVGSTWGPTMSESPKLAKMIATGAIGQIKIIVDGHGMKLNPKDMLEMEAVVGRENIRMSHIHAKIITLRGPRGGVVITSSMNWSKNPRVEQFTLVAEDDHAAEVEAEMERMWSLGSTEWGAVAAKEAFDRLDAGKTTTLEKRLRKIQQEGETPIDRLRREAQENRQRTARTLQGIPWKRGDP